MTKRKHEALEFDLKVLPPPTVPPISWAEARADYKRGPVISSPEDVSAYFKQYIGGKQTEASLTKNGLLIIWRFFTKYFNPRLTKLNRATNKDQNFELSKS